MDGLSLVIECLHARFQVRFVAMGLDFKERVQIVHYNPNLLACIQYNARDMTKGLIGLDGQ